MSKLSDIFKKFFKIQQPESVNVEELRVAFQERYHNFKLLLNANNKSLEIMAGIEQALQGNRPFGMSFVKANCTAVSVNVLRMVKNIEQLAPGKYEELNTSFNNIQRKIDNLLTKKESIKDERLIIPLSVIDRNMVDLVGSKMANLGEIKNGLNLKVDRKSVV